MSNLNSLKIGTWQPLQWGVNETLIPLEGWEYHTETVETGHEYSVFILVEPTNANLIPEFLTSSAELFKNEKLSITFKILITSAETFNYMHFPELSDFYFGDNIQEKYLYKQIVNFSPDLILICQDNPSHYQPIAKVPVVVCHLNGAPLIDQVKKELDAMQHSEIRNVLTSKMSRTLVQVITDLSSIYGQHLNLINYTQGVGIYGRLSISESLGQTSEVSKAIDNAITDSPLNKPNPFGDSPTGANLASTIWAYDLSRHLGSSKWDHLLTSAADMYKIDTNSHLPPFPCDPTIRTEDMFYSSAVLGRAYKHHANTGYLDVLDNFYLMINLQQSTGLFWHSKSSPYVWSRGNGFAVLGLSEYLTYVPENRPLYDSIKNQFLSFFKNIVEYQDISGGFHELLDTPSSYLEFTSTCIIGYAALRGKSLGILGPEVDALIHGAWHFVKARVDADGNITDACFNTGLQPDLESYYLRPAVSGHDDRSGSMALLFTSELLTTGFNVR